MRDEDLAVLGLVCDAQRQIDRIPEDVLNALADRAGVESDAQTGPLGQGWKRLRVRVHACRRGRGRVGSGKQREHAVVALVQHPPAAELCRLAEHLDVPRGVRAASFGKQHRRVPHATAHVAQLRRGRIKCICRTICKMQDKVKPPPANLAAARRRLLQLAQRVPTVQAAADTGIHQSQVSRLFRGQFTRLSPNVRTLLAYAANGAKATVADRSPGEREVVRAALRAWDATPEGARALVRLLKSVREVRALRGTRKAR